MTNREIAEKGIKNLMEKDSIIGDMIENGASEKAAKTMYTKVLNENGLSDGSTIEETEETKEVEEIENKMLVIKANEKMEEMQRKVDLLEAKNINLYKDMKSKNINLKNKYDEAMIHVEKMKETFENMEAFSNAQSENISKIILELGIPEGHDGIGEILARIKNLKYFRKEVEKEVENLKESKEDMELVNDTIVTMLDEIACDFFIEFEEYEEIPEKIREKIKNMRKSNNASPKLLAMRDAEINEWIELNAGSERQIELLVSEVEELHEDKKALLRTIELMGSAKCL